MRWRLCKRPEGRLAALGLALALAGCSASVEPPAPSAKPEPEAAFLVDPLRGYPLGVSVDERLRLSSAHEALVARRDSTAARKQVRQLLERNPDLHPATLVLAQVDLAAGNYRGALDVARHLTTEVEGYFAAGLAMSRAAEKLGEVALAYEGYFDLAELSSVARERADELRPRALEIVTRRVADAIRRGRIDEAGAEVARLARWAPGEAVTLRAARDLAAAVGDRGAELAALRRLEPEFPDDLELRADRAELELEVGDPSTGLRIYQDLAAASPADPELAGKLGRAKFLWRLTLLPAGIQTLVRQPQLSRGEFASVLYWLFPQVRYGRSESGTIATDVLDHQHRAEIVRVVNLGLAEVDPTLHTFRPNDSQTRGAALVGLLELLARREPPLACLGATRSPLSVSAGEACRLAAACGLIGEVGECLPLAALSGPAAFEMSRGALGQLGIE